MNEILSVAVFIFGLLVGSFLNVYVLRYNTGKGLRGRSCCLSCGETLSAGELVPLFSFLFLRGRCIHCKSRISLQYPIVELVSGLVFLGVFLTARSPSEFIFMSVIFSLLLGISMYDMLHGIIPNRLVFAFIALSLAALFVDVLNGTFRTPSIVDALSGPLVALPLWFLFAVSKGKWIGLGDAKLALGIGWLFGMLSGFTVLVFSFWIGALVSLSLMGLKRLLRTAKLNLRLKRFTMKSEIPFAPFLAASALLVYFLDLNIATLLLL
ncbi:prepilin peptidase [Candidatus Kaiserbacteria bacterium]|nr:prepilin peptidase [Candidatus Kaiserbacteria bacterium]